MRPSCILGVGLFLFLAAPSAFPDAGPWLDPGSMCRLLDGETKMVNALWIENPPELRMGDGRSTVTIADLKGPGVITMIHFALPATMKLDRSVALRMYWDGEEHPSVEVPLTDFFCDPNGALDRLDSALVNKNRGWNAYFLMPFAKSARIEISCDNPRYPAIWETSPCYSYVMYREVRRLPKDLGYFHAFWRQETLLLGARDYDVFEAQGRGHFIGWNVTVRGAAPSKPGYPVDENPKLYVDGETEPRVEWQGLEDSFGFSWGFPETGSSFPYTGFQPYLDGGAAAYRFCINDRVSFKKSIKMTIGFGKNEHPMFHEQFSKPENPLQFSSVAYWYQTEPHTPLPPMPSSAERQPAGLAAAPADAAKYAASHETLVLNCGNRAGDIEYLKDGWDFILKRGYLFSGWTTDVNHCWADKNSLEFEIKCPKGAAGTLRLFIIDGDNFEGGRKQSVTVAGRLVANFENFQKGQWVEVPISAADTADGGIPVVIKNEREGSNAVVSLIRFVGGGAGK